MGKPEAGSVDLDAKFAELMALSPEDRIRLGERLIESVPAFASPEIEQAWNEQIARRIEEFESGRVQAIPAEEVHAGILRRLNGKGHAEKGL